MNMKHENINDSNLNIGEAAQTLRADVHWWKFTTLRNEKIY